MPRPTQSAFARLRELKDDYSVQGTDEVVMQSDSHTETTTVEGGKVMYASS
jgi:hypothetical protein